MNPDWIIPEKMVFCLMSRPVRGNAGQRAVESRNILLSA